MTTEREISQTFSKELTLQAKSANIFPISNNESGKTIPTLVWASYTTSHTCPKWEVWKKHTKAHEGTASPSSETALLILSWKRQVNWTAATLLSIHLHRCFSRWSCQQQSLKTQILELFCWGNPCKSRNYPSTFTRNSSALRSLPSSYRITPSRSRNKMGIAEGGWAQGSPMCNALAPSSFQFLLWGKDSEIYTSLSHPKPLTQAVHFITARLGTPFAERPKQSGRDSKAFLAKQLSKRSAGSNSQTDEENPTPIPPRQHNVVLLHQFFLGGGEEMTLTFPFVTTSKRMQEKGKLQTHCQGEWQHKKPPQ